MNSSSSIDGRLSGGGGAYRVALEIDKTSLLSIQPKYTRLLSKSE